MDDINWDNISDGIKKAAKTVGNVAAEVYDQGKKQVKKVSIKGDIRQRTYKIGELVVSQSENGVDQSAAVAELVKEVAELKTKLTEKTDDDAAVAELVCPKCGSAMPSNAVYCFVCGQRLQ